MKKMYNQPQTEIDLFKTDTLLDTFTVSEGKGNEDDAHMPRRRGGDIIP